MVPENIEKRIRHKMESRGVERFAIDSFLRMVRRVADNEPAHVPLGTVEEPDPAAGGMGRGVLVGRAGWDREVDRALLLLFLFGSVPVWGWWARFENFGSRSIRGW